MAAPVQGQLVPQGGGDSIPLIRNHLVLGRRDSCDIRLAFPNVSGVHCELNFKDGYWILQDLKSTNGVKVNGTRVQKKVLQPGDAITIAKRTFHIEYELARGLPVMEDTPEEGEQEDDNILGKSLLERAGLLHPPKKPSGKPYSLEEEDEDE